MQLLFKRLDSERLVHMLEEQGVWALLESGSTFLQGAGLLARWAPRLPCGRWQDLHCVDLCPTLWDTGQRESFLPNRHAPGQEM